MMCQTCASIFFLVLFLSPGARQLLQEVVCLLIAVLPMTTHPKWCVRVLHVVSAAGRTSHIFVQSSCDKERHLKGRGTLADISNAKYCEAAPHAPPKDQETRSSAVCLGDEFFQMFHALCVFILFFLFFPLLPCAFVPFEKAKRVASIHISLSSAISRTFCTRYLYSYPRPPFTPRVPIVQARRGRSGPIRVQNISL